MTFNTILLITHISFGITGLLSGLSAMLLKKRIGGHSKSGEIYHSMVLGTCITGIILAIVSIPIDWGLIIIAGLTYGLAFIAYRAAKIRRPNWLVIHAPFQLASYLFMVEATVITNWKFLTMGYDIPNGWAWLLPALIFYPAITITYFRVRGNNKYAS